MAGEELFPTRDLNLAATLLTLRFQLVIIDFQVEGMRSAIVGYFNFADTPNLQTAIKAYWRNELAVEPRALVNNMRSLKAQVSNVYKNPSGFGREEAK